MGHHPFVLITNDDGIGSVGLVAAANAVAAFADLLIVAPSTDQTGMGRAYTRRDGAGSIAEHCMDLGRGSTIRAYSVIGSPAETVAHAILEIAPRTPDLCIAGINHGANVGLSIGISGTIGAALEADALGVPAMAVSHEIEADQSAYRIEEWASAESVVGRFAAMICARGLPTTSAALNLNLPRGLGPDTPVRRTRQAQQNVFEPVAPESRDRASPHRLKIATRIDDAALRPDDDVRAVYIDREISYTLVRRAVEDQCEWRLDLPDVSY